MTDILHLRTMARKSVFDAGKYEGFSVGQILDLGSNFRLAFVYYKYAKLSFLNEVLDEIGITKEFRISKPGTDMKMFGKWKLFIRQNTSEEKRMRHDSHLRRVRKAKLISFEESSKMSKTNIRNKHRKLST